MQYVYLVILCTRVRLSCASQTFMVCAGGKRMSCHFRQVFVHIARVLATPIRLRNLHLPSVLVIWSVLFKRDQETDLQATCPWQLQANGTNNTQPFVADYRRRRTTFRVSYGTLGKGGFPPPTLCSPPPPQESWPRKLISLTESVLVCRRPQITLRGLKNHSQRA